MTDPADTELFERVTAPRSVPLGMDRDDLRQEILLKALEMRQRGKLEDRSEGERIAYLKHISRSVTADLLRRQGRSKRGAGASQSLSTEPVAEQTSPSGRAVRREQLDRLLEAIATLPADQREAIRLKHLEALSVSEVAARMGKSTRSVAGLLRRGLAAVRQCLAESGR